MDDTNRHLIGLRLEAELQTAWQENQKATAEFNSVMKDIPSGLPQPDGTLRIRQAGAEMNAAIQNHMLALKRYVDFMTHGILPEALAGMLPRCNEGKHAGCPGFTKSDNHEGKTLFCACPCHQAHPRKSQSDPTV